MGSWILKASWPHARQVPWPLYSLSNLFYISLNKQNKRENTSPLSRLASTILIAGQSWMNICFPKSPPHPRCWSHLYPISNWFPPVLDPLQNALPLFFSALIFIICGGNCSVLPVITTCTHYFPCSCLVHWINQPLTPLQAHPPTITLYSSIITSILKLPLPLSLHVFTQYLSTFFLYWFTWFSECHPRTFLVFWGWSATCCSIASVTLSSLHKPLCSVFSLLSFILWSIHQCGDKVQTVDSANFSPHMSVIQWPSKLVSPLNLFSAL